MKTLALSRRFALAPLALLLFVLASASAAHAVPIVALRNARELVIFDSNTPNVVIRQGEITGPPSSLIGIDFRPATGRLYALGSDSRLYLVNLETFAATPVVEFTQPGVEPTTSNQFGFDFDPFEDRARLVGTTGQSLSIQPDPFFTDPPARQDPPIQQGGEIITVAYDNNFDGATHTMLYGFRRSGNQLVRISTATGEVTLVGPTGVLAAANGGMDIAPVSGTAYAVLKLNSPTVIIPDLYRINLATGAATLIGPLPSPGLVVDIAVMPPQFTLYAVNDEQKLARFSSSSIESTNGEAPITGLLPGETVTDIDVRPANGALYALGRTSDGSVTHLYTIHPLTGVATLVSPTALPLTGEAGMDFDPTIDRLRITTSTQNLHVRPSDGAVATHTPLFYPPSDPHAGREPSPVAMAHSDNWAGTSSATSYLLDSIQCCSERPLLARLGSAGGAPISPNSGRLIAIDGPLNETGLPVDHAGFDIAPGVRGPAYASFISMDDGFSRVYTIKLATATVRHAGKFLNGSSGDSDLARKRIVELSVAVSGTFEFSADTYTAPEECAALTVTVTRTGDTSGEATVDFATSDSALAVTDSASSRSDYTASYGTLVFDSDETSKTFTVLINEDSHDENAEERAILSLRNPSAGFTLGARRTAALVITDDATEPAGNAIDDSETFVCQHYHDFLNRDPDAAGLAFWTNNIESCGTSVGCRQEKRIETSAAFFLSGEFQETGFTVVRAHRAAFAHVEDDPFIKLDEFLPDAQRIGRGYVVGQPGAEAVLAENKRAFFEEFVMRPEFVAIYGSLTSAEYVDLLNANSALSLSPTEVENVVSGLTSGRETRATVLRRIVEDAEYKIADRNRAFVLMQYFGYLRRDPDAVGFAFWLDKLNDHGGDFRAAEMVKAFITSSEYRQRFGD
ncbi:MAG TPA: DUF4394 domain-containing protein [Pyrinomonadaceae bacterium]|nr:DUF4394 domain-containing protein [Pyrinomonadaceae bacterium]